MSDINELHSASVTKLVGANNTTGIEDNFVDADGNGNLKVIDYATSATGAAVPADASLMGTKNPSGILTPANSDASGNLLVGTVNTSVFGTFTASDSVVQAPDGQGTLLNGASTSGSIVYTPIPDGYVAWTVLMKGYVSGAVYTEASTNTTNGTDGDWIEIKGRKTGTIPGVESVVYALMSNGYYRGNAAGFKGFRTRLIGAVGPSIQIQLSSGQGATFLNSSIPAGTNTIGQVYSTSASGFYAAVSGFNRLNVSPEPSDLLNDKFDSTLDTANRWTTTVLGTASSPSAGGSLNMNGGTTSGNAAILASIPLFTQKANVQLSHGVTLKFEAGPILTGAHRFWGFGSSNLNTVSAPLSDAIGWELDTLGILNAVIYQGGTKIFSSPMTTPTDGKNHRYSFQWRTDKVVFYFDSGDVPSAVANGFIPNVQVLPARFHVLVGSVTTSPTLIVTALGISDTGRNSTGISDGTYGFRKLKVNTDGSINTTPITNAQLTSGQLFSGSIQTNAASANVDNPIVLFRNPVSNTKTAYIKKILVNTEVVNVQVTYKVFSNPTLSNTVSTITNITQAAFGSSVTVTTSAANGASVGATVVISGTTHFNGTYTVASVSSSTSYTFTNGSMSATTVTNTSGTSTITSLLGTAFSGYSLKIASSPPVPSSLLNYNPTLGANGSQLMVTSIGQNSLPFSIVDSDLISVDPGQSILIAASPASNSRSITVTIIWAET